MNKVVHINLGGYPFTMDEDAFDRLTAYVQTLQRHFRGTEGAEEIISDIEARLAELFQDSLGARTIVTVHDVQEAIAVMGTPEDFGADSAESTGPRSDSEPFIKTGKRLFRDPENKVVAGVCSGVAAYFGISDPVWVRLVFALVLLSGGFGAPLYFILWAIMPEARTAADRLAMRGESINVSNISRLVKEEFENLSQKVSDLNKEFTGNSKDGDDGIKSEAFTRAFEQGSRKFAAVAGAGATLLATLVTKISSMAVIAILLVFAVLWFGIIGGLIFSFPYLSFLFPGQETVTAVASISMLFVIGIPLLGIALALARLVFRTRVSLAFTIGMWVLWFACMTTFLSTGSRLAQQFSSFSRTEQEIDVSTLKAPETVIAISNPISYDHGGNFFNGKLQIDESQIRWQNTDLRIYHSDNGQWKLVERRYSRGASTTEAESLTRELIQAPVIADGRIELNGSSVIPKGKKWRGQEVIYELYIPEGATVRLSDGVKDLISSVDVAEDGNYDFWDHTKTQWQMTPLGLAAR